ncbi:MAG TPA: phosphatase PAP2 family protein [Streptosporangiaceae bacterium]|jgi:membrane-associated phospholipid phosphatase
MVTKALAILLWFAGIGLIALIAWLLAERPGVRSALGRGGRQQPDGGEQPLGHRHAAPGAGVVGGRYPVLAQIVRMVAIVVAGSVVIFGVMLLIGLAVKDGGPSIDKPIFSWMSTHREHVWKAFMVRATEIGDKFPVWAAAGTAAVCLAVTWRDKKWLPPVALGLLIVANDLTTRTIRHIIHRPLPPGIGGGPFPSGGSDRAVAFYGLIAYLLWREFSGSRRGAVWAGAAVAAIGFNEGYSRWYLGLHWFTDVLSGLFYGGLLLALFIIAVRAVAGPARRRPPVPADSPSAGLDPATVGSAGPHGRTEQVRAGSRDWPGRPRHDARPPA